MRDGELRNGTPTFVCTHTNTHTHTHTRARRGTVQTRTGTDTHECVYIGTHIHTHIYNICISNRIYSINSTRNEYTTLIGGVLVVKGLKRMDCGIVVSELELYLGYYVHFRANILGKGMNPLILPAMG